LKLSVNHLKTIFSSIEIVRYDYIINCKYWILFTNAWEIFLAISEGFFVNNRGGGLQNVEELLILNRLPNGKMLNEPPSANASRPYATFFE